MDTKSARWRSAVLKLRPILRTRADEDGISQSIPTIAEMEEKRKIKETEDLSWRRLFIARAKLKASAKTSEILSLFTLVTMVEVQINSPTEVPEWLWIIFTISTTVLVSVHVFALMIATYILPAIEPMAKLHRIYETPHEKFRISIELAWILSNTVGLFLFIVQVVILCWVKFYDFSHAAAITAVALGVPSLVLMLGLVYYFYQTFVTTKWNNSAIEVQRLEQLRSRLDSVA